MANPSNPVTAAFPIAPPQASLPIVQPNGLPSMQFFQWLQMVYAAIQGSGGAGEVILAVRAAQIATFAPASGLPNSRLLTGGAGVSFDTSVEGIGKIDVNVIEALGYTPVNKAGDHMLGELLFKAASVGSAGLNVGVGVDPSSPTDGDLWVTSTNAYIQVNGVSVPLGTAAGVLSFNTRTGAVILLTSDIIGALGYTPAADTLGNVSASDISSHNYLVGGTALRSFSAIETDYGDVNNFLNSGDTDYDGAFSRCLAACSHAYVPAIPALGGAVYAVTAPIILSNGQSITGDGAQISRISSSTANVPVISLGPQLYNFNIANISVEHSVSATAGGCGIFQPRGPTYWVDNGSIENVVSIQNWGGFDLGVAFYCKIINCSDESGRGTGPFGPAGFSFESDGVSTVPSGTVVGTLQWYLSGCEVSESQGNGFQFVTTATGPVGPIPMGTLTSCLTFACNGYGAAFLGSSDAPLAGPRIFGGFYGASYSHNIYLDTYTTNGGTIEPEYVELAGNGFPGAGDSVACGIYLTVNNPVPHTIRPGQISQNNADGILAACGFTVVQGGIIANNGISKTSGRRNGIYFFGGTGSAVGVTAYDYETLIGFPLLAYQEIGIFGGYDGNLITGCDLQNNGSGGAGSAYAQAVGIVNTIVSGCLPLSINTGGGGGAYLPLSGGTITGNLVVNGTTTTVGILSAQGGIGLPSGASISGTTGSGITVDNMTLNFSLGVGTAATGAAGDLGVATAILIGSATGGFQAGSVNVPTNFLINNVAVGGGGGPYLPLSGGTITGNLVVNGTTTTVGLLSADGGIALPSGAGITGTTGSGITVDNMTLNISLGVGTPATGVAGEVDVGGKLNVGGNLSVADSIGVNVTPSGTPGDIAGTTLHVSAASAFSGNIALLSGAGITGSTGSGLTIDNITVNKSVGVGTGASGSTGVLNVTTAVELNGVPYINP